MRAVGFRFRPWLFVITLIVISVIALSTHAQAKPTKKSTIA